MKDLIQMLMVHKGGMYQLIKENFPEKTVITVGKDSPSLEFFV